MNPNIKIGDIIWSETYKSCGIVLEETENNYGDHSTTDYYVFIFDDVYMSKFKIKPKKDNIVIHNKDLYGKTWCGFKERKRIWDLEEKKL